MTIFIALVVLIVVFALIVVMQPSDFSVTRSAPMTAAPEKVFAQVNDFRAWEAWSPWAKLDPNTKTTFEGPAAGAGAIMRWDGNNKVGAGSMTILESRPSEVVKIRLDFLKPMRGTNDAEFKFQPNGTQTTVTWSMTGKKNFVTKAMGLFFNCEKMIGGNFEKGLSQMKTVVER